MDTLFKKKALPFLEGGGEMGMLTRKYDWSQTPVGPPEEWPQSLRNTVSMILTSKFPMFLWWGDDMIQFYNDAYRPSLGNDGKHPKALGEKAIDCWPEIWDIIYPLIHQVRTTGEATWSEDQLVPIYRNGKLEDVYWTFGYSPIRGDSDEIEGVLVVCQETTQKVIAQKNLEKNASNLENIILKSPVAMCILKGTDFVVDIANEKMLDLWGKSREVIMHKPLFTGLPEVESHGYYELLTNVMTTGETFTAFGTPVELIRKGKPDTVYVNFVYEAYRENNGAISGVMVVANDVTEQMHAQFRIEKSEQEVRTLVESAPYPIGVYVGKEMRIQLANQTMLNIYGKGPDVIGKLYTELLPELSNQEIFKQLDEVYTSGIAYHAQNRRVDIVVDGKLQPFYFNYSFTPLFDASGKVYGVMNTGADVTDLNVAKIKLEESETNLRNMIIQAPVPIAIFRGKELVVEIANNSMFRFWGRNSEEVMNKPLFDALPEARNQGYEQLLANVLETGERLSATELPVTLHRDGSLQTVYMNFTYEPIREVDGNISGIMAMAIDVTEQVVSRKKIEEVVAQRTKELAEANDALLKSNLELARSNANLEEFAYAASHDMKEPIRKIHFFSDRLKERLKTILHEDDKVLFGRMENASKRMGSLIDDLLSYSQVSVKPRSYEEVDLKAVVTDVLNDFDLEIEEKQAKISIGNLPVINGYHRQLQQAFQNLISNALKYSKSGQSPEISIRCTTISDTTKFGAQFGELPHNDYYLIEIKDNGIGFEQSDADRIFNVFTRLHGNTEFRGTGVGLSIVRKVIQNHNGYITASSEPGTGSCFTILLPAN